MPRDVVSASSEFPGLDAAFYQKSNLGKPLTISPIHFDLAETQQI
jgi:hypothetical protein